jgi:hypothetical protein
MLELRELKACSTLLGACTTYPLLRSDLKAIAIEIKDLKHRLDHLLAIVSYPLRVSCVVLSRVSISMLPRRTLSFSRRLPI